VKRALLGLLLGASFLSAQSAENVLVVVNSNSPLSRRIGEYYVHKRGVPLANVCRLRAPDQEEIARADYETSIENPIAQFIRSRQLKDKILYIVTTQGVPLKIAGRGSTQLDTTAAAVDSELALLYQKLSGRNVPLQGMLRNPYFGRTGAMFRHPDFPIYLVTRLAAYNFNEVQGLIDRAFAARNQGKFVLDMRSSESDEGNRWLRAAARGLPKDRVVLDQTSRVLYGQSDVIGYASWGSNDPNRKQRFSGFHFLPGAVVTEFVSTDGRTFTRPPDSWNIASSWSNPAKLFAGSPQSLTADCVHEGATGCSGHVYEPFLEATPRPDYLLPAYFSGRTLAESYYAAIPALSWQNIVIGDPLCRLR
jgi:uncharacterized protein (TIGR03790 family)